MRPTQLVEAVNDCIDMRKPFFIWGPPGIGKSKIVQTIAAMRKLQLRDVRLSQMDAVDIRGFPSPDHAKRVMNWLPPGFLPTDKRGKGLIFLDELNSAPQANQAPCYQLLLDRRLGDYELPESWSIGAAGNRTTDRAIVHEMSSALKSRMIHLDLDVSVDDWKTYARSEGVHPNIIGYISYRNENLHRFEPNSKSPAYPCPRTWFDVDMIEKQRFGKDRGVTRALITGAVGQATAFDYETYLESAAHLPDAVEVRMNPDKVAVMSSPAACHAVVSMLVGHTTPTTFPAYLKYVKRMVKEFQVVYIRDAIVHDPKVKNLPEYRDWCLENEDVLF